MKKSFPYKPFHYLSIPVFLTGPRDPGHAHLPTSSHPSLPSLSTYQPHWPLSLFPEPAKTVFHLKSFVLNVPSTWEALSPALIMASAPSCNYSLTSPRQLPKPSHSFSFLNVILCIAFIAFSTESIPFVHSVNSSLST